MPVLSLKRLSRAYGKVRAVDGVDLEIRDGEFVSLLGPSGCGKTTTLRMIAGFIDPTEGTIEVDGKVLSAPSGSLPPEKRGMSMIFQSYAIWPNMTVTENVGFGLKLRRLPAAEQRQRIAEVLDVVQMSALADRYPAELSGGQQQRVALARAIVVKPAVLLLDEPLSNLDANLREEMRFEIRRLHEAFRITTVYVTHDQAEAMATSDRIAVMNQGRLEQIDDPYHLYTRPRTRFVAGFIGRTNLMQGKRDGASVAFDGFALPAGAFDGLPPAWAAPLFSVRPQTMRLIKVGNGAADAPFTIAGRVEERTFLGEHWDYVFAPDGSGLRLKVSAMPSDIYEAGEAARLALEPRLMVPIE
jgi:ABC-type Fe3+/spermidine/putrescine transport system ATPase subunit